MNTSKNRPTFNKFAIIAAFATLCFTAGFFLATSWEMPARAGAQTSPVVTAADKIPPVLPIVDEEGNSPFVAIAEIVKPVVVNISAQKNLANHPRIPFDIFDMGPFFRDNGEGSRRVPQVTSGGSGIVISEEGYILTNNHVISGADEIIVKFADNSESTAKIIGADPETDVALIKVDRSIPAEMIARLGDSDKIRIGGWAIAVGNPFGLDWTVTVGVISARGRSNLRIRGDAGPSYQDFIQTDASINLGNSGGPLVNIHGEVIGINTAINAQAQGIGFAIPINLAKRIVDQLKDSGIVRRGYLGMVPTELTDVKKEALGINPDVEGVFVEGVQPNTPAEDGGLIKGDVILGINGEPVTEVTDFRFRIADIPPSSRVRMDILRSGKIKNLKFKLADRSEFLKAAGIPEIIGDDLWLGIETVPTDSPHGKRLGVDEMKGVLVIRIEPDSPADGFLDPGDVIVEIGDHEIRSIRDYLDAAEELKDRKKAIAFWVIRDGRQTFVPIRPENL